MIQYKVDIIIIIIISFHLINSNTDFKCKKHGETEHDIFISYRVATDKSIHDILGFLIIILLSLTRSCTAIALKQELEALPVEKPLYTFFTCLFCFYYGN